MKKTAFAAKSLIALIAAGMISCAQGDNKETVADSAAQANATETAAPTLNIRYVDIDSVMAT